MDRVGVRRYNTKSDEYNSCQLTSVPVAKFDLSVDFQSDVDYDFYEKNVNASPSCRYSDLTGPYGQRRKWLGVGEQDTSLWQDYGVAWAPRNDIVYGNDRVYYDPAVVLSTPAAAFPGGGPLLIRPNVNGILPPPSLPPSPLTPAPPLPPISDRLPVLPNGKGSRRG